MVGWVGTCLVLVSSEVLRSRGGGGGGVGG